MYVFVEWHMCHDGDLFQVKTHIRDEYKETRKYVNALSGDATGIRLSIFLTPHLFLGVL